MKSAHSLFGVLLAAVIPLIGGNATDYYVIDQNTDIVDSVNDTATERLPPSAENDASLNGSGIAGYGLVINEVELNPMGNDTGTEWVELFNPGYMGVNASDLAIIASKSSTARLLGNVVIEPGQVFLFELAGQELSNVAESLNITNMTSGTVLDSTLSFVDTKDDNYTWQRFPDGVDQWQFLPSTRGVLNDPSTTTAVLLNSTQAGNQDGAQCLAAGGCLVGVAVRIADGDTLYVNVNRTIHKISLALAHAPSRTEDGFIESTWVTRSLCLGSEVAIDPDYGQIKEDGSLVATVYCSSTNLNMVLLESGLSTLNIAECPTSEFAETGWAKNHGC